jgi:hypothetical protein
MALNFPRHFHFWCFSPVVLSMRAAAVPGSTGHFRSLLRLRFGHIEFPGHA